MLLFYFLFVKLKGKESKGVQALINSQFLNDVDLAATYNAQAFIDEDNSFSSEDTFSGPG